MQREIGSNFWINPHEYLTENPLKSPVQFGCDGSDYVWLSTGRSAIRFVIKTIEERGLSYGKSVILPPFTCHTVIEPFLEAGYDIHYYPINESLQTSREEILSCVDLHRASVVLYHRYYGFDTLPDINKACIELRTRNVFTIEDCTQCLYSCFEKSDADFFVGSIRKWTGTPDGGFAVCRNGMFDGKPTLTDIALEKAKIEASYSKYRYLFENIGDKSDFLKSYRNAEDILAAQKNYHLIASTSRLIQSNLNIEELKKIRRTNFQYLLDNISPTALFHPLYAKIENEVVPLYFPIIVEDRAPLQSYLAHHSIYAPVVWPKAESIGEICREVEYIYEHLLCIPIDQRYDDLDMERIANTINNYNKQ